MIKKKSRKSYRHKNLKSKEKIQTQQGSVPLNISQSDRISFSVLRDKNNKLIKIENISYEINIEDMWEWVVRYDDHGGTGSLHRHTRISLENSMEVESATKISKKAQEKADELTWVFNEIKKNYLTFRSEFLKNNGLDLY